MTQAEYKARLDAIIESEYEAIGGDGFRAQFGDEMLDKLVVPALVKRQNAECERDPEFKAERMRDRAKQEVDAYLGDRQPVGAFREDGWLKVSKTTYVQMPMATRDHLVAWALHESDERNLDYIARTLAKWDRRPQIKTLAELEAAK